MAWASSGAPLMSERVGWSRSSAPPDPSATSVRAGRCGAKPGSRHGWNHPHVVAFIDEVIEGPERWLVMEYVPSESLAQILDRSGPLSPHQVTHLGGQIASALEAVHATGIVHRDVKPGNILVTENGTAKLTDFGISRPICGDLTVTDSGVIGGTVAFIASEVADGQEATPASDVFALGATLFAAVEGIPPFGTADNPLLVLRRAAAGDLLPFRRAGPLAPVLSALLQPDPAKRPDAASTRQLLQQLATTSTSGEGPLRWPVWVTSRRRRSRRSVLAAAGAGVAALATIAGLLVFRPHGSTAAGPVAVLGDPRTADPCALTDPATLKQFGATTRKTAYGNFNRCDVVVKTSGGSEVVVKVDLDKLASPDGKIETMKPLQVFPQPRNGDHCDRIVPLADQNRVSITATHINGPDSADLCAMATVATDSAVTVLGRGAIPRRSVPPDAASLAWVNACTLLDTNALSSILGRVSPAETGFADWECRWHSNTSELSVHLQFDRNAPLSSADGRPTTLSDHDAYITEEADEPDCLAQVVNRKDFDANGDQVDEVLQIAVSGPRPVAQLCEPARALAAAAAAKLPPSR